MTGETNGAETAAKETSENIDDKKHPIRDRAYEIWEQEGRPEGRALNHWLRAKWEIEHGHKTGTELKRLEGEFESMRRPD
ncbi:DUF2934 domain-containing protein [Roseiarcus sp.]|uniref:DUF2934 domain-containing protein n=1 Tax=Roseiarcus sp. TaxID=1969460 RepID=UPI003F9B091E